MSIDTVALLRIPDWTPSEELDVRELEDAVMLFLEVPFEAGEEKILEVLEDTIGDVFLDHEDERGIFLFPDAAEPDAAETYDAVIAAVGEAGLWLGVDAGEALSPDALGGSAEALVGQVFESMGLGDPNKLFQAMASGDTETLQMAQIKLQGMLEEALRDPRAQPDEHEEPASPKKAPDTES